MFNGRQKSASGRRPGDENLLIKLYPGHLENHSKTIKEGLLQCDDVDMIEIRAPGQRDALYEGPVRRADIERFTPEWEAYKANREQPSHGMPIENWGFISRARAAELQAVGVPTLEALASVDDERLRNLGMGARDLRQKAIDFLAAAKSTAPLAQMREEIESLKLLMKQKDDAIEALRAEIGKKKEPSLSEAFDTAIEPKTRKRG